MLRPIESIHGGVAELSCGHEVPAGEGTELDCVRCERFELPDHFEPYKRTSDFDEHSLPAGLRADHSTKRGVWAVIHVLAGALTYVVEPPLAREQHITAGQTGIVVPEVKHRVRAEGSVRFFVEFHRKRAA